MARPLAFITGAGRGVGRAIALRLAHDGYAIAVVARSQPSIAAVADEIAAAGGTGLALKCDVSNRGDVRQAVKEADQALGPIEVLVNNAGIAESAPFTSMDDELWERTLSVNLSGTYHCMRAVLPGMFERRHGRVINIASSAGKVGFAYTAAYAASKHGVLGLTRSVALEAEPRGVTVNAICPGWINTDMTERAIDRIVERTRRNREDVRRTLEKMNPKGRLIEPGEVADVVAYLASKQGGSINGQAIDV